MTLFARTLVAALVLGGLPAAQAAQEAPSKKIDDGLYAVLRVSLNEKELQPLKPGEALVIDHHRFVKGVEPVRYVVVHTAPEVKLDLVGEPKAVKEDGETTRILLKLKPTAAAALEKLTSARPSPQIAIVLGGEVVTMHKVRETIKGGEVQITSCAPGGAAYLLEQLQAHAMRK
jgi:preprotein translocase subunit SecD